MLHFLCHILKKSKKDQLHKRNPLAMTQESTFNKCLETGNHADHSKDRGDKGNAERTEGSSAG